MHTDAHRTRRPTVGSQQFASTSRKNLSSIIIRAHPAFVVQMDEPTVAEATAEIREFLRQDVRGMSIAKSSTVRRSASDSIT